MRAGGRHKTADQQYFDDREGPADNGACKTAQEVILSMANGGKGTNPTKTQFALCRLHLRWWASIPALKLSEALVSLSRASCWKA